MAKPGIRTKAAPKPKQLDAAEYFRSLTDVLSQPAPFLSEKVSDATAAITATTILDDILKYGIILKFRRNVVLKADANALFKYPGPLATFAAKITLASMLGIIPNDTLRAELDGMREIRNAFCHTLSEKSFADEDIQGLCAKLSYSNAKGDVMQTAVDVVHKKIKPLARAKFVTSTLILMSLLSVTMIVAEEEAQWASEHHAEMYERAKKQVTAEFNKAFVQFLKGLVRRRPESL